METIDTTETSELPEDVLRHIDDLSEICTKMLIGCEDLKKELTKIAHTAFWRYISVEFQHSATFGNARLSARIALNAYVSSIFVERNRKNPGWCTPPMAPSDVVQFRIEQEAFDLRHAVGSLGIGNSRSIHGKTESPLYDGGWPTWQ